MMANVNSPCDLICPVPATLLLPVPVPETPMMVKTAEPSAASTMAEGKEGDADAGLAVTEDLIAEVREPSGAPDTVKFRHAGRDHHRPNIETAILSVLINHPKLIETACQELAPGDFYLEDNHALFSAILHLSNGTRNASAAALIDYFEGTEPDRLAHWFGFVNACAATAANWKHLSVYIKVLKAAAKARGGDGYCPQTYSEFFCAQLLIARMPPTKCIGETIYQYQDGVWSAAEANLIQREALAVMHPAHCQSKRAAEIIKQVMQQLQIASDTFCGAYREADNGRILINAESGVIEVSPCGNIRLIGHSAEYGFTGKLHAAYAPKATCALFDQVLAAAQPDPQDRLLIQVFSGYVMMPSCKYESVMVFFGPSGTGKSTIAEAIANALGPGLVCAASLEELCKKGSYTLSMLDHNMLNLGTELTGTEIEESANFKKLVSGEAMTVRDIYRAPRVMRAVCKHLFVSNNETRFRLGTDAETRRLRILHFVNKPANYDPSIKERLAGEASGILNWMLEGLVWLLRNNQIPEGGKAARDQRTRFDRGNDRVGAFVRERCELDGKAETAKGDLWAAFEDWCDEYNLSSENAKSWFFRTLTNRYQGVEDKRRGTGASRKRFVIGIRLTEAVLLEQAEARGIERIAGEEEEDMHSGKMRRCASEALERKIRGT